MQIQGKHGMTCLKTLAILLLGTLAFCSASDLGLTSLINFNMSSRSKSCSASDLGLTNVITKKSKDEIEDYQFEIINRLSKKYQDIEPILEQSGESDELPRRINTYDYDYD